MVGTKKTYQQLQAKSKTDYTMGTVDIEEAINEFLENGLIEWDGETPTHEEFCKILREIITEVTNIHYKYNDGKIEDWDIWEQDIIIEVNKRLDSI